MIEEILIRYLGETLGIPVFATEPENPPESYLKIEKTGSGVRNWIRTATVAVQSYGPSMLAAAELNERVVQAMLQSSSQDEISRCELNSDYNFTDPKTRRFRYQAVFDLTYFF